ncbi:MAG: cobalt ECF transporter T component CbiQ [Thermodesulfobacteriota bacterium]|nr:cobalt ECF transporter T component CbiQ [Thermodesulfobacteriota bacterium]
MIEEDLTTKNTVIHNLDPRVKVIIIVSFSVIVAILDSFIPIILSLFIALILVLCARLPIKKVFSRMVIANLLIILLWFFLPFTVPGNITFSIGPLHATSQGILYAGLITLRSNAIILALMTLLGTTSIISIGQALNHMYVPNKLVNLLFLTYRYTHVIYMEYNKLKNAMKIRGFKPGTNIHTYKSYAYLVGMLLVNSYDRGQRIRSAMLCRGFKGRFYHLNNFCIKGHDIVSIIMALIILTTLVVCNCLITIHS